MELTWLSEHRAAVMAGLFVVFVVWESLAPAITTKAPFRRRWLFNYSLYLLASALSIGLHALPGLLGALWADHNDTGLFNNYAVPVWLQCLIAIGLLDLKHYVFHRVMHRYDVLWRFHRLHHSDDHVDLTTGFRFHPVEAVLSVSLYLVIVAVLGVSPAVVLLYWLLLVLSNFFTHANIHVPETADRFLEQFTITPSMHRLHHSRLIDDQGCNYGSLLCCWDRWMGTFKPGGSREQQAARKFGVEAQQA